MIYCRRLHILNLISRSGSTGFKEDDWLLYDLEEVLPEVLFGSSFPAYKITKFEGNEHEAINA